MRDILGLRVVFYALCLALGIFIQASAAMPVGGKSLSANSVPILLYHRFGPTIADSMTVTTNDFQASLEYLREKRFTVIPLRQLVDFHLGKAPAPPPRSVVITFDDGHRSLYTEAYPLVRKFTVPVTLFIYPSAISNAPYALTWGQLREMKKSGFLDCQSHAFWHPNFRKEKKRLGPDEYDTFIDVQLIKSKAKLEKELGEAIDMLAWPFGIHDENLIRKATAVGYRAAFTMDGRPVGPEEEIMTLPRYLISGEKAVMQLKSILAASN